jgi:O-antigen ligase
MLGFYYIGTAMAIPLLFSMIITNRKIQKNLLVVIFPFVILIAIGTFRFADSDLATFGKDFWVFSRIPIAMIVGYIFFTGVSTSLAELRTIIIVPSLMYAIVQLSHFALDPSLLTQTAADVRAAAGTGDVYLTVGLVVSLSGLGIRRRSGFYRLPQKIISLILFAALILSFSRALTVFFIMLAAFVFWRKQYWKYAIVVVPLIVVVTILLMSTLKSETSNSTEGSFAEKIGRAGSEIAISDYDDQQDINLNWRGYESYMALKHYKDGDVGNYLFGYGFGELVDVGLFIKLGGEDLRLVPYFHNGYLYLLIKTGAFGLLLYLFFIYSLFMRFGKEKNYWPETHPAHMCAAMAQGILVGSLFMTYIITGLFNKSDGLALSLLLGGILACCRNARKVSEAPVLVQSHQQAFSGPAAV